MVPDNIVFAPLGALVLSALVMGVLRLTRPAFSYQWLIATFGALFAWTILLLSRLAVPVSISTPTWGVDTIYQFDPSLLVDETSWAFGVAICTLILSSLLTEVVRSHEVDWMVWIGKLSLGALGLLSVFSGNPLTLILTWGAIDLTELLILLFLVNGSRAREKVVISFSARTGGSMMLLVGYLLAGVSGGAGNMLFSRIGDSGAIVPTYIAPLLLISAGLRLGVIPLHLPMVEEKNLRVGFGSVIRGITTLTGIILLVRSANLEVAMEVQPILLGLAALASVFAAVLWISSKNGIEGRPYWILGMASITLAASVLGIPASSQTWAIAALLPSSILFLNTVRHPLSMILLIIALISLTGLPFTPSWEGVMMFSTPFRWPLLIFLISHSLLLLGFIRHMMTENRGFPENERWIKIIYFWGLGLFLLVYLVIGWLEIKDAYNNTISLRLVHIWPGLVSTTLVGLSIYLYRRYIQTTSVPRLYYQVTGVLRSVLSFNWLYRTLWRLYHSIGRTVRLVSSILEGNGGVLWTLLLMVLLFTFLAQSSTSGN